MTTEVKKYPARLEIDYPAELDRFSSFFRIIVSLPIIAIVALLTSSFDNSGVASGLFIATALMIVVRQRYPKWWFDFGLELTRFSTRVSAYMFLLTDKYPSTEDDQSVHLELDYPDANNDLNRWLPLIKWFLALPHYVAIVVLLIGAIVVTLIAWFAILFTGKYPKSLFDYVVGVYRWGLRVQAYAFFLTTDKYPPFTLK